MIFKFLPVHKVEIHWEGDRTDLQNDGVVRYPDGRLLKVSRIDRPSGVKVSGGWFSTGSTVYMAEGDSTEYHAFEDLVNAHREVATA